MTGDTEHGAGTGTGDAVPVPTPPSVRHAVPTGVAPVPLAPTTTAPGTGTGRRTGTARRYRWYNPKGWFTGTDSRHARTGTKNPVPDDRYQADAARTEAAIYARLAEHPVPDTGTAAGTGTNRRGRRRTDDHTTFLQKLPDRASTFFMSMPLVAPLIASGFLTFKVLTSPHGLDQDWWIAVLMVLGLEGVVWTLNYYRELRLVAGHSTMADQLGISLVVAGIGALIYWHALVEAKAKEANARAAAIANGITDPDRLNAITVVADWRAAAVAASMAAIGVFVRGRKARWDRRVELEAAGRIDMQALRIGIWQWILSPWESFWSFRHGMKYRIPKPTEAVRDWRRWKLAGKPAMWPPVLTIGTDGRTDELVPVPATLLAELLGQAAGTDTRYGPSVPTSPVPTGTTSTGTGTAVGTAPKLVPAVPAPTAPGTAPLPHTPAGTGTGTNLAGTDTSTIARYRARNEDRLWRIRSGLDGRDGRPDWRTMPEKEITLTLLTTVGGFKNRGDANECKSVLLADRARQTTA